MAISDIEKERLAFVSGNILVCGLLSLKLWPVVSRLQTGMHIHFFTDSDPGGDVVGSEFWIFSFLTKILTALATAGFFAVVYLLLQGLKLSVISEQPHENAGVKSPPDVTDRLENFLDGLSHKIYGAVFFSGPYLLIWTLFTILGLVVVPLEVVLAPKLRMSVTALGWILRIAALLLLTVGAAAIITKFVRRMDWGSWKQKLAPFGWTTSAIAIAVLLIADPIITHSSYTLDLNLKEKTIDRTQTKFIEVQVTLGGATSSQKYAKLQLADSDGRILLDNLTLNTFGKGQYVSYISASESALAPGRYQVIVTYPHYSLDSSPPFIKSNDRKEEWFFVIA